MTTARALVEYVFKKAPRVKLKTAAEDLGMSEAVIREAASKRLWHSIRIVGKPPNEYLSPAQPTVDGALRKAEDDGCDVDGEVDEPRDKRPPTRSTQRQNLAPGTGSQGKGGRGGGVALATRMKEREEKRRAPKGRGGKGRGGSGGG